MLLLDFDRLKKARERSASDGTLKPTLEMVRADIAQLTKRAPRSVLDKELAPPSGNKHDYYSFGPYWWPDPNSPNGLPYIRRDGEVNSAVERTDFATFRDTIRNVDLLAMYGFYTGDETASSAVARQLRVWFLDEATRMNPHLEYAQAIPGICDGRGIGLIDTAKLCLLPDVTELLRASGSLALADESALLAWLETYLDWMLTSEHGKAEAREHNNHGTWYDAQIATFALATKRLDIAREVLENVPSRRFATHIAPDGSQPHELTRTNSFGYSCYNLEGMFHLARLGEHVGLDLWSWEGENGATLRKALEFLAPYADAAREWPYPQIVPRDCTLLHALLRRAPFAFGDVPVDLHSSDIAAARLQLLWPA
jgi:hypothetical protein